MPAVEGTDQAGSARGISAPRVPWPEGFPDAFVHVAWPPLKAHPRYHPAKRLGDARAATQIVEHLLNEETIHSIGDHIRMAKRRDTYVVAPAVSYESAGNILPFVYAKILASEFGIKTCMSIYQHDGVKRDLGNFWQRFANPVSFYGNIPSGGDFIIVDDVITTGGTLAALRGFIEMHGGTVICMTGLASRTGGHVTLSLRPETCYQLKAAHAGALASAIVAETGYAIEHLTEPEGQHLGACTPDRFRQGIAKARHGRGMDQGR